MRTVNVRLGPPPQGREYKIHVGHGLIDKAGQLLAEEGLRHKAVIVTDTTVGRLYAARLKQSMAASGFETALIELPPGEQQKSLETAAGLYSRLSDLYAERTTPIVALGGGVIGDLAGFVAATYMRGVPLVQVPTTILSQGDSSIGGKVAVNHGNLKNKIGAFYHPRLTISDVSLLESLSPREVSDGLAEIIKHGMILDAGLFEFIDENLDRILSRDVGKLEHIVGASASIKARVVEEDELDLGPRNVLNYGHTVGHAVESVSNLQVWHGEAVAIGMVAEARIACSLGILEREAVSRLEAVLRKAGLTTQVPDLDRASLLSAMKHDKKVSEGRLKFALPTSIGAVMLTDQVEMSMIEWVLAS